MYNGRKKGTHMCIYDQKQGIWLSKNTNATQTSFKYPLHRIDSSRGKHIKILFLFFCRYVTCALVFFCVFFVMKCCKRSFVSVYVCVLWTKCVTRALFTQFRTKKNNRRNNDELKDTSDVDEHFFDWFIYFNWMQC